MGLILQTAKRVLSLTGRGARGPAGIDHETPIAQRAGRYLMYGAGATGRAVVGVIGATMANAVAITDLAAASGSALVGYRYSHAAAAGRSMAERADDIGLTSADWSGLVGDGQTDVSDALEAWLAAGSNLTHQILMPGRYRITRPLQLPLRLRLLLRGSTLVWDGTDQIVPSHQAGFLISPPGGDIEIARDGPLQVLFTAPAMRQHMNAVIARNVTRLRLTGLDCVNVNLGRLLAVNADGVEVGWGDVRTVASGAVDPNTNRDILVADCSVRMPRGALAALPLSQQGQPPLHLLFAEGARIERSDFYDTASGPCWFGGDANANTDGAIANERKCSDVTIDRVKVYRVSGGGIWGSMGRNVRVTNPTVDTCGDVGLDSEGGVDVVFEGGSVKDAANGCLTTFSINRGIAFRGIKVRGALGFRLYNNTQSVNNADVTIEGCDFAPSVAGGYCRLDADAGPARNLVVTGNRLTNAYLAFNGTINIERLDISRNQIVYTNTGGADAPKPIVAGSTSIDQQTMPVSALGQTLITITDNILIAQQAQTTNTTAIEVQLGFDFSVSQRARITGNVTLGWAGLDLDVELHARNAGVPGYVEILGNSFGGGQIRTVADSGNTLNVTRSGNRNAAGATLE